MNILRYGRYTHDTYGYTKNALSFLIDGTALSILDSSDHTEGMMSFVSRERIGSTYTNYSTIIYPGRITLDGINVATVNDLNAYATLSTAQTIDGAKIFTGTVGNVQTTPGVYLGLDENAEAVNATVSIVSANTAAYIDMGRPDVDYDFRIIKWNTENNLYAQFVYAGNATASTITIPMRSGIMALNHDLPSAFA